MAPEMRRGGTAELTREIPSLTSVVVGISWNAGSEATLEDNLVMAAILCDDSGHAVSAEDFVFFNQLASPELSVRALETVLGGDKEQIEVDLTAVPAAVDRLVFVLYLNEGSAARRTLGQLRGCAVRVLNLDGNAELVRSENLATALREETGLVAGELYRHRTGWKFRVVGQGYSAGLRGIAADYRIPL